MRLVISPAYGRDYSRASAALADWKDGKDFVNESRVMTGGGRYVSVTEHDGPVEILYAGMRKVVLA